MTFLNYQQILRPRESQAKNFANESGPWIVLSSIMVTTVLDITPVAPGRTSLWIIKTWAMKCA